MPNSIHVSTLLSRVFLKYLDKSTTNLSGPTYYLQNPYAFTQPPPELTTSKGVTSAHTRATPPHHHSLRVRQRRPPQADRNDTTDSGVIPGAWHAPPPSPKREPIPAQAGIQPPPFPNLSLTRSGRGQGGLIPFALSLSKGLPHLHLLICTD